jgi:hypothetical protein
MLKDMFPNRYIFYSVAILQTGKAFQNIVVDVSGKDDKTKASEFPEIDRKSRRSYKAGTNLSTSGTFSASIEKCLFSKSVGLRCP